MGVLMKTLDDAGKRPSAYSVKKTSLFDDLADRIRGALLPADLEDVEQWLDDNDHTLPHGWREPIDDMIEVKREELAAESVPQILRDRFDF